MEIDISSNVKTTFFSLNRNLRAKSLCNVCMCNVYDIDYIYC